MLPGAPLPARVLLWTLLALSCACERDPTQIVVAVNTDYAVPSGLDAVRFEVDAAGADVAPVTKKLTTHAALPLTLAVNGKGGKRVTVTVSGLHAGEVLVRRRASAVFESEHILALPMDLLTRCAARYGKCERLGLTCGDTGDCMPVDRGALDGWNGPPRFDPPPVTSPDASFDPTLDASDAAGDAASVDAGTHAMLVPDAGGDADVAITPESPIIDLALGGEHSCVLRESGEVSCWGADEDGQLGTASTCESSARCAYPRVIKDLDATDLSAGDNFTCAVTRDDHVMCWGDGGRGQMGSGPPVGQFDLRADTPTMVPLLDPIASVQVGGSSACALHVGGGADCWGDNAAGQLRPDLAGGVLWEPTHAASHFAEPLLRIGSENACVIYQEALYCQGRSEFGVVVDSDGTGQGLVFAGAVASVDVGGQHACARQDGKLRCWGNDQYGQLGAPGGGTRTTCELGATKASCSLMPVEVEDPWGLEEPALGRVFSCAVVRTGKGAGRVACWGDNMYGVVDAGSSDTKIASPTLVEGLYKVRKLAAGGTHACVLTTDQRVVCWGSNTKGQLGPEAKYGATKHGPVEVPLR